MIKLYYPPLGLKPDDFKHPAQIALLQIIQQQEWLRFLEANPVLSQKILYNRHLSGYYQSLLEKLVEEDIRREDAGLESVFNLSRWEQENPEYTRCRIRIAKLHKYFAQLCSKADFGFLSRLHEWGFDDIKEHQTILSALMREVEENLLFAQVDVDLAYLLDIFADLPVCRKTYRISYRVLDHFGDCTGFPTSCEQCLSEQYFGFDTRLAGFGADFLPHD